jgi:DnaK suppressor protein
MTNARQVTARAQLVDRRRTLAREIRDALIASGEQHFIDLAGEVPDAGETSFAHLLADVEAALTDRHVQALRDIDAALARLDAGEYGRCEDCGTPIPDARLSAWPEARRCVPCQTRLEHGHGQMAAPRL